MTVTRPLREIVFTKQLARLIPLSFVRKCLFKSLDPRSTASKKNPPIAVIGLKMVGFEQSLAALPQPISLSAIGSIILRSGITRRGPGGAGPSQYIDHFLVHRDFPG